MRTLLFCVSLAFAMSAAYIALEGRREDTALAITIFRDCASCPEMVVVPSGSFLMGAQPGWVRRRLNANARPRHMVTLSRPFALGRYEVTFAEWDACVAGGGCEGYLPGDEGFGRNERPVINVSWNETQAYTQWLSTRTGYSYRLPTESEWEYAARAGTTTPYPWGITASHAYANYGRERCCSGRVLAWDQWEITAPVGRFPPNPFGLHDMHGNVYEWVMDCHVDGYESATGDGGPVIRQPCTRHGIRGGAWYSDPGRVTSSYRAWQTPDRRDRVIGFRVARDL